MAKITGIGGVFIKTNQDEEKIKLFYEKHLGLPISKYGINLISETNTTLITISKGQLSFPSLNFTVDNITEMIEKLREDNIEITQEIVTYDIGKFARIKDCCGNEIELWEPVKEVYIKTIEEEIKQYKEENT